MAESDLPPYGCNLCQQGVAHPERDLRRQTIALLSRLDENQRRWCVALEAQRLGYGADRVMAQITGMNEKTIRRGHRELAVMLVDHPVEYLLTISGLAGRAPTPDVGGMGAAPALLRSRHEMNLTTKHENGHPPPIFRSALMPLPGHNQG